LQRLNLEKPAKRAGVITLMHDFRVSQLRIAMA
jgi:hypothetical protein